MEQPTKKSCQERVDHFFAKAFNRWGLYVAGNPCKVFWLSMLLLIVLSSGMSSRASFPAEQLAWTPEGNPSVVAGARAAEMFPATGGFIGVVAEAKEGVDNVLTLEAFREIDRFDRLMKDLKVDTDGREITYDSICIKAGPRCISGKGPLTFVSNEQLEVQFDSYGSDADLLKAIKSGIGGASTGSGNILPVTSIFGGTTPESVDQRASSGENNIEKALAASFGYAFSNSGTTRNQRDAFLEAVEDLAEELNKESKGVNLYLLTDHGLRAAFSGDLLNDLSLVQISVTLVAVYCILFMGSFSPIHFRSAAAGITLLCVMLSYAASSGLAFLLGFQQAGIHSLLPFLLIGIGVDDMFVLSSAVDQTDATQSVSTRMKIGMMHAGSSITITSLTNIIAFLLGATGSLNALASFCFFAALGILCLYFSTISIFAAFMVWDLKRQHKQRGDCCGACCCAEDTILCCRGACLTEKQKAYPFRGERPPEGAEVPKAQFTTATQKLLQQDYAPILTSKFGILAVLALYAIYFLVASVGVTFLEVDYKQSFFISGEAYIKQYLDKNDQYFKSGPLITVYTDGEMDFTREQIQRDLQTLNWKLLECRGCE